MKNKDLRIFIHNLHYVKVKAVSQARDETFFWAKIWKFGFGICYYSGLAVLGACWILGKTLFLACYHIGNTVLSFCVNLAKGLLWEFSRTRASARLRLNLISQKTFLHAALTFTVLAIASSTVFLTLNLAARGLEIKDHIINSAFLGKFYLEQAKNSAAANNLSEAQNKFRLAYSSFETGQKQLETAGSALSDLIFLVPQARDMKIILEASRLVSDAGDGAVDFYRQLQDIRISTAGINSPNGNVETFDKISNSLDKITLSLSSASQKLNAADYKNLPQNYQEDFLKLRSQISSAAKAFSNTGQIFSLTRSLFFGDKRILLIFENNNELRASGGFIGTYGIIHSKDGKIEEMHISSIYDLDGQLKEKIMPPRPMLNVNDRWFMRDANWFADFPASARKIISFYEKEGGLTPDSVIAVTPHLIQDLLKISGPVSMPEYKIILNQENFLETVQAASSGAENQALNQPKQILADFVPRLLQQMEKQNGIWPGVLEALQKNLVGKNVAIYSRNLDSQNLLESFKWTGSLQKSDRDFLSVVSSNLGGTKTDLFLLQKMSLDVNINEKGEIENNLELTRTNRMPDLDNTHNLSFLRFYVPLGSQLQSNIGFDYKNLEPEQGFKDYKSDPDVFETENKAVKDLITGTVIGQESDKTYFGNWLNVKGGETKTVRLSYKLPFKINSPDRYVLLLQKQMGAVDFPVDLTINFQGRTVEWKNFDTDDIQISKIKTSFRLDKDYLMGTVLSKNR